MADRKAWGWQDLPEGMAVWEEPAADAMPFMQRLQAESARRVYDLGCGIGRHTVMLAREGFEVCATDLSPEGAQRTAGWLRREGLKAHVQLADMVDIPFKDDAFDGVLAFRVIYHAVRRDVERVLAEIRRVLGPGGLLLATFQSTHSSKYGRGRKIGQNTFVPESGHETGIPHFFANEPDVEELLTGFELLRLEHKVDTVFDVGKDRNCYWIAEARHP